MYVCQCDCLTFPVVQSFLQDCRMFEVAVLTDDMVKIKGGE